VQKRHTYPDAAENCKVKGNQSQGQRAVTYNAAAGCADR
jgi:hypothetical protein